MPHAQNLRIELSARNQHIATTSRLAHELTRGEIPSVIFGCDQNGHGNFHPTSYRNICANPQWARRLAKVHTASRRPSPSSGRRWMELDCANSSDALLMNIFCYSRTVSIHTLAILLGVEIGSRPQFGFRPGIPLRNGRTDRTEIDMKLGDLMVEAKLTETDFQTASAKMIERYRDLDEVFDPSELRISEVVPNYQLIRGVLAAAATGGSFCVLCDARRPDLIENWYFVVRAVKNCTLRIRLKLVTWQELYATLPLRLQQFLEAKYGIIAAS